jgi:ABC-2 type transport system permease protein
MSHGTRTIIGTLLILVIAFCTVFVTTRLTRGRVQVDLTQDQLYSLTEGTKNILAKVREPLTLELYYSKTGVDKTGEDQLLQFNNYYLYVRDLLRAYARQSPLVTFVEYDPRPYSDAEEKADVLRLQRFNLTETEGFYFGLAATGDTGEREVIPFLASEEQELVEYRISELIDRITRREKSKIGVLSSMSVTGGGESDVMRQIMRMQGKEPEPKWIVFEQLARDYEIVDVAVDAEEVPEDLAYLMVIHPKELSETTLYAIDQYVMGGGKLLVFVDPWCIREQPEGDPRTAAQQTRDSDLNRLLSKYGVRMEPSTFAGDLQVGQTLQDPQTRQPIVFPGFLSLGSAAEGTLAEGSPITQSLEQVLMLLCGVLRETDVEGVEFTPLLRTTGSGNTWQANAFELGGPMGPALGRLASQFRPGDEQLVVAARLNGKFPSAFDGPPKKAEAEGDVIAEGEDEEAAEAAARHRSACAEPNSILVFADVDMITDFLTYRRQFGIAIPSSSNVDMLLNGLDALAGSSDLLSVRARGKFQRPFRVVEAIERRAELERRDRIQDINAEIKEFRDELRQLQNQATQENVGLLENELITKQRDVEAKIREKERELRQVQAASLEEIESLGTTIKVLNIGVVPGLVLLIGVAIATLRSQSRRRHVTGGAA